MKRMIVAAAGSLLTFSLLAQSGSQTPYAPILPATPSVNVYDGYNDTHASTLEEGAMRGLADVVSAKGEYNLSTSAAAINLTQAQKQDIENRRAGTQAYFEIRETNRAAREANRSPRLSQEQLVRIATQAAPKRLSTEEINLVTGEINWPEALKSPRFAGERGSLDQLSLKRAQYGALGIADHIAAGDTIQKMAGKLKEEIKSISANEYLDAKNFLKSLMYAVTKTQLS
jgi:hypothetical protein